MENTEGTPAAFAVGDVVELSLTRTSQRRIILSLRTVHTGMVDFEMSEEAYTDLVFGVAQIPASIRRLLPKRKPLQSAMAPHYTPQMALVGECNTCGNITAIDLVDTAEHWEEMQRPGRTVKRLPKDEALALWQERGRRCDHGAKPQRRN
jgi:hypothetical protein